jgi:hypothetical protein
VSPAFIAFLVDESVIGESVRCPSNEKKWQFWHYPTAWQQEALSCSPMSLSEPLSTSTAARKEESILQSARHVPWKEIVTSDMAWYK